MEWLNEWGSPAVRNGRLSCHQNENIGISRGLNILLTWAAIDDNYDVYVKVDNDCEVVTPGAIKAAAETALATGWIVSPTVEGLRNQVPTIRYHRHEKSPHVLRETALVGGLCMAIPAAVLSGNNSYTRWRFDDDAPVWGTDDTGLCAHHRANGGHTGYLAAYTVNHYRTTDGQHEDFPSYFLRRMLEGGPE